MKFNKAFDLDSYLLSIILHIVVFLLLSLFSIKQSKQVNELVLELFTPEHPEVAQEDFTKVGASSETENPTNIAEGSILNNQEKGAPVSDITTPQPNVGRSIEPPITKPNTRVNSSPISGTSSGFLTGIKKQLGEGGTGSSGFQMEDDGGNISVLKSVLPVVKINDYGTVKIQFKLNRDGTVSSESVIPVIIDDPVYTNASIDALKKWRFSVRNYSGNKAYRITFIFKPETR